MSVSPSELQRPQADKLTAEGLILPVYKPTGVSSFAVVKQLKRIFGIKKIGHAGTLDPFAEGVLVVGVGRAATKRLCEFQRQEKEYIGRVTLGVVTDTYDPDGEVIERHEFTMPDETAISKVLGEFEGEIEQTPPRYSAVKVKGMRSYRAVRQGLNLSPSPRKVHIKRIELLQILPDGFEMRVVCAKGTYIRTLAYDIGRRLGMGAHLGRLIRNRIGAFRLEDAKTLTQIAAERGKTSGSELWK